MRLVTFPFCILLTLTATPIALAQGDLSPSGAPAPIMKTLDQVEPRTLITNLPWTITTPGSYYVVGNFSLPGTYEGITIQADSVTLDLGGFVLTGPGAGHGIYISGARNNVAIRNGTLCGWLASGIDGQSSRNCQFTDLRLFTNGVSGLSAGHDSLVLRCSARQNKSDGIQARYNSVVRECTARSNGRDGIWTDTRCTISECSSYLNDRLGIRASTATVIDGCAANDNDSHGIETDQGCVITRCQASNNGTNGIYASGDSTIGDCVATHNGNDGIFAGSQGLVRDCVAYSNKADGIRVSANAIIRHCVSGWNDNQGFSGTLGSSIENCVARENDSHGIYLNEAGTVRNCTVSGNRGSGIVCDESGGTIEGCRVFGNDLDGVKTSSRSLVINNIITGNAGGGTTNAGLYVSGTHSRIDGNHVADNTYYGIRIGGASNLIVRNSGYGNGWGEFNVAPFNALANWPAPPPGMNFTNVEAWANFDL